MKKIILFILVSFAILGCDEDEEPKKRIFFNSSIEKSTKASVLNNTQLGTLGFGVLCYAKINGSFDSTTDAPNYYYNIRVYNNAGVWQTATNLYWPESTNDKVSFVTYAPYATVDNGITLSPITQVGFPKISYFSNNIDITKQIDFCYAPPQLNKTKLDGTISFGFKHALTKLSFSAKNYYDYDTVIGYKVKSIRLTNIKTKGDITLNSSPHWTPSNSALDSGSYYLNIANNTLRNIKLNLDFQLLNQDNAYLMLVPQIFDALNTKLEVSLTDLNGVDIKTTYISLSTLGISQFTMEQNISIRLIIIAGNVYASIQTLPWNTYSSPETTIGKK
ncbi:MAG: hypothetical protein H6Q15_1379 [Bacteroidetes bacterium]|nr:hypothetical protein [Bacteroidota bacterium]